MFQGILLGVVQGIAEWLPVSSEGALVLIQTALSKDIGLEAMIRLALFLHGGTLVAALVYFRQDVATLIRGLFQYQNLDQETKRTLIFLATSTTVSGIIGGMFLIFIRSIEPIIAPHSALIMAAIGLLLVITGLLHFRARSGRSRTPSDLRAADGIIVGVVQGFAALPGLSRSGLTVSALLMRNVREDASLKLSFLMSIPIVLVGNIVLNLDRTVITSENIAGFIAAFVLGLITIHALLKIARAIQFGYFTVGFGLLAIIFGLVG